MWREYVLELVDKRIWALKFQISRWEMGGRVGRLREELLKLEKRRESL